MKTLQISIVVTSSLFTLFLIVSQHASADSCSARLTSYDAPQFYLLADGVFSGTVQHITNTTDHQWNVYFTVDKLWKGSPSVKPLMIMTNTLQGCGYSIIQGEKYLVYTNGYPPFFNIVWSKPYADAQSDITIIDDPKFQSDEKAQMELNKKLEIAKDAISNLMGSKMGSIPFNLVGVDEINSTLDVGIDSTKATLSEEQYLEKIKEIVGDIPIKITFGQNVAGVGDGTVQKTLSPLEQFKSRIDAQKITCSQDLQRIIKSEDGSPACVKPETANILYERGWAVQGLKDFANPTGQGLDSFTNILENNCGQFHTISVKPHNGTVIPALLTYSNSTGCARLTYTINYNYNDTSNGSIAWPRIANFSLLHIDTLKYTSNGDSFGVTSGKDFTNSFKITAVPEIVDLANFPIGSNFTITYIIRPLPNATGFYDESIPEPVCLVYPLAVNYNADQVNLTDFSKGLINMQNHSCFNSPYELSKVEISGMNYKEMILP